MGGERDKFSAAPKPARAAAALAPALILLQWSRARETPALPTGSHPRALDGSSWVKGKSKLQLQLNAVLGDPAAVPGAGSSLQKPRSSKTSSDGAAPGPGSFGSIPSPARTGNGALCKHRLPKSKGHL